MAIFLSLVWLASWIVLGVFAFLAGKHSSRKYLAIAVLALFVMYGSVVLLGWY